MIAIIDYGAGNIHSISNAFKLFSKDIVITQDPNMISQADKLVVPGQGAFPQAMKALHDLQLIQPILTSIESHKPFLGICLGFQILFEGSHEHSFTQGLGVFPGVFEKIPDTDVKVPHMGWNACNIKQPNTLFSDITDGSYVYFVHSYYLTKTDPSIVAATTPYPHPFISAVATKTVWGTQFHPEKSSRVGLSILEHFCSL